MTERKNDAESVDRELMDAIANDSIKLFSINLVILTILITVVSFGYREGGVEYIAGLAGSPYAITGIMLWLGSMIGSIITYRFARRTMLRENYKNSGTIPDEQLYLNQVSAVALGSLMAVFSFIVGLLDAFSQTTVGLEQPLIIAVISIVFVMVFFNLFSLIDMYRNSRFDRYWERVMGSR